MDAFPAAGGKNARFDWSTVTDLGDDGRDLYGEPLFWVFVGDERSQKNDLNTLVKVWAEKIPEENLVFIGKKLSGVTDGARARARFVSLLDQPSNIFRVWSYVLSNYRRKWYIRADLHTVFVTDTLYAYLSPLDERVPWYLGRKMVNDDGLQYASARAGYMLSSGAAGRLSARRLEECEDAFLGASVDDFEVKTQNFSVQGDETEFSSQYFAMCLLSVGVFPEDTRDWNGHMASW